MNEKICLKILFFYLYYLIFSVTIFAQTYSPSSGGNATSVTPPSVPLSTSITPTLTVPPAPTASPPLNLSSLPTLSPITQMPMTFFNFIKSIEILPDPAQQPNLFILRAVVFTDGSLYIAGNTQNVATVQIPVMLISSGNNTYTFTDRNNNPITDIAFVLNNNTPALVAETSLTYSLKDLMKKNYTFLSADCDYIKFYNARKDYVNLFTLETSCDLGFGFPFITTIPIVVSSTVNNTMFDQKKQAFSNVSHLNGMVQLDYGVNGVALNIYPAAVKGLSGPSGGANTGAFDIPFNSLLMQKVATITGNLGPNIPNTLTNTPNFYTILTSNFDFFHFCNAAGLEYVGGEGLYKLSANCVNATGNFTQTSLNITLTGLNGRYKIGDDQGRQLSNITYNMTNLSPVYSNTPDLLTLVGRKFSIFNSLVCLRNSITLTPSTKPQQYTVSAQCMNDQNINTISSVDIMITGSNGVFQIKDLKGQLVSDIFNDFGQIKIAPLIQVLSLDPRYSFSQSCSNAVLLLKDPTQSIYTLSAQCPNPQGSFSPSQLDLILKEQNGVFTVFSTTKVQCQNITTQNGTLMCVGQN